MYMQEFYWPLVSVWSWGAWPVYLCSSLYFYSTNCKYLIVVSNICHRGHLNKYVYVIWMYCIHVCMCVYTCMCIHVCVYTCMCVYMFVCISSFHFLSDPPPLFISYLTPLLFSFILWSPSYSPTPHHISCTGQLRLSICTPVWQCWRATKSRRLLLLDQSIFVNIYLYKLIRAIVIHQVLTVCSLFPIDDTFVIHARDHTVSTLSSM